MTENTSLIEIDKDLVLNVDTGIIGSRESNSDNTFNFPIDDLENEINKLEEAINDLETSLDPHSTSRLSQENRNGIYEKAGLLTNVVIGVIIALIIIIMLL